MWKRTELLMAPSQIDRASWAIGRADSAATRIRSPKLGRCSGWGQGDPDGREAVWEPALHPKG